MSDWFVNLQKVLPQHALSRLIGKLGSSETDWVKSTFIKYFTQAYAVDLSEAERCEQN